MLNLMLLRHGKSDWDAGALDDHSRPLNARGDRSARAVGAALTRFGSVPDLVISSTAVRARTTAELAIEAGSWDCRYELDDALYGASVGETLAVVPRHTTQAPRVMLVGHQPTWSMTVRHLTGGSVAIRTATVADIEVAIARWSDLPSSVGSLVSLIQPRMLLHKE